MSDELTPESLRSMMVDAMQRLFEVEESALTLEAKLYEDLDIDSIDSVNLIIELRNRTGRDIAAEHFREVRTVGDVLATLEQHLLSATAEDAPTNT